MFERAIVVLVLMSCLEYQILMYRILVYGDQVPKYKIGLLYSKKAERNYMMTLSPITTHTAILSYCFNLWKKIHMLIYRLIYPA